MIRLGQKIKDRVTGFEGVAVGRVAYLNGCIQYLIKPEAREGKMVEEEWIDEQTLEVIGQGLLVDENGEAHESRGGPQPEQPPTTYKAQGKEA